MQIKNKRLSYYFGDREFYTVILSITIPILIQNTITNFVNLLDNIMVGQLGTEAVSAVAIINQLMFVYNLCVFGGLSGAGIFTAQFSGSRNNEGIKSTVRFKLLCGIGITAVALFVFLVFGDALIGSYLSGSADGADPAEVLRLGRQYVNILLVGIPAFMLTQVYTTTLKECGETVAPMRASVTAVMVNLVFNFILIYGHFGFPRLGVAGAAIATSLSRYVELAIILVWTGRHSNKAPYFKGVFKTLRVPLRQAKEYGLKGLPLLFNEALWSSGIAILNQCYSLRGIHVVAGMNISMTITNLLGVVSLTLGTVVSIIVGQQLGAGELERAKQTDTRMIVFAVAVGAGMGVLTIATAPFFPLLYNVDAESRSLATKFILISALYYPMHAFLQAAYFTLRTGGKTMITFFFDCGYTWVVNISLAWALSRFTLMNAVLMYLVVEGSNFIKCIIGYVLVHRNVWLKNIVGFEEE